MTIRPVHSSPRPQPVAPVRRAQRDEGLKLAPVPRGFREVDPADGSMAYSGDSSVRRLLEANQVKLVVVRHGQSQSNADSEHTGQPLLYGRSESPLTEKGRQQARECATELYRELGGDAWLHACLDDPAKLPVLVSSTVSRAVDTADILADHILARAIELGGPEAGELVQAALEVKHDGRLLETDFGRFEKRPLNELQQAYPEFVSHWRPPQGMGTDFRHRFPGGESRADAMHRTRCLMEGLATVHPGRTVVLVTHGETVLAARTVLGLVPQEDGKVRAQTGTVANATPYWLVGTPPVPPQGGGLPKTIPY